MHMIFNRRDVQARFAVPSDTPLMQLASILHLNSHFMCYVEHPEYEWEDPLWDLQGTSTFGLQLVDDMLEVGMLANFMGVLRVLNTDSSQAALVHSWPQPQPAASGQDIEVRRIMDEIDMMDFMEPRLDYNEPLHRPVRLVLGHKYLAHGENRITCLEVDTTIGASTVYRVAAGHVLWREDPHLRAKTDFQGSVLPQHGPLKDILGFKRTYAFDVTLPVLGGGKRPLEDVDCWDFDEAVRQQEELSDENLHFEHLCERISSNFNTG